MIDATDLLDRLVLMSVTASRKPLPTNIGIFRAKTELSRLLRQVRAGKHFVITQRGQPIAEVGPLKKKARWGDMQGKIRMSDDFCDPIGEMRDYMP